MILSRLGWSSWCSACCCFNTHTLQKKLSNVFFLFCFFAFCRKLLTFWLNGKQLRCGKQWVVQRLSKNTHFLKFISASNKGARMMHDVCRQHVLQSVWQMLNLDLGLIFFVSAQHQHVIEGAVSLFFDIPNFSVWDCALKVRLLTPPWIANGKHNDLSSFTLFYSLNIV